MPLLLLCFPERSLGLTSFSWSGLTCWLKPVGMSYHHWSPYPSSSLPCLSLSRHGSELFSSPLWNLAGMAPAREVELRSAARAHWPSRRRTPTSLAEGRGADRRSRFKKEVGEEDESISLTWSRWPRLFFGVAFARDGDLEFTFVHDQLEWPKYIEMNLPFGG